MNTFNYVGTASPLITSFRGQWSTVDTILGGTTAMRAAGKAFLPQEKKEKDENYIARLNRSTFDNYYKDKNNQKEYKTGLKIGNMMKEQLSAGLTGDSTLNFNEELFQKGLVKGISGDTTGITGIQAIIYFQNTIQKIQNAKLLNANPVTVPTDTIKK